MCSLESIISDTDEIEKKSHDFEFFYRLLATDLTILLLSFANLIRF